MTMMIDGDDRPWDLKRVGPLIIFRGSLWETVRHLAGCVA